jgi:hypothetical protein
LLRSLAISLSILRAVNPTQPDALRVGVVQDFDGVAVEDRDDRTGEGRSLSAGKPTDK